MEVFRIEGWLCVVRHEKRGNRGFAFALKTYSGMTAFSLLGFSILFIQESGKARNRARIVP